MTHPSKTDGAGPSSTRPEITLGSENWVDLPGGRLCWKQLDDGWDPRALVDFAARSGAKRSVLLVSKVLGKHLPVSPSRMAASHRALADRVPHALPGPILFVGFGETATGLGWGVYEAWRASSGRQDTVYLHTTRYVTSTHRYISFREEHSHAPAQCVCVDGETGPFPLLRSAASLVVIDDELTTGRTAQALASALQLEGVPLCARVALGLVGAYGASDLAPGGALHGWDVRVLARMSLAFSEQAGSPKTASAGQALTSLSPRRGARGWGRHGAKQSPPLPNHYVSSLLSGLSGATDVVMVASGECMHPAFVLGTALEQLKHRVTIQSTTRSTVLLGGAIQNTMKCRDPLGSQAEFYLHNPPSPGPRVVVLHEPGGAVEAGELAATLGGVALEIWDA